MVLSRKPTCKFERSGIECANLMDGCWLAREVAPSGDFTCWCSAGNHPIPDVGNEPRGSLNRNHGGMLYRGPFLIPC